ncbi:MAG: hypothetical protein R3A46_06485 [Thermomicrobiales bacterium]
MQSPFDPREHLRQLEDGRDYLDLKWRLVWLRAREPESSVETQVVPTTEDEVVCRATISLRSGASATAHGSANRSDDEMAVETAENRALARALASLGFGAEYLDDDDITITPIPSPPVNLMTARALMDRQPETYDTNFDTDDDDDSESFPEDTEPPAPPPDPETLPDLRPASTVEDDEPPASEDISWTKFWAWAKPRGYGSALELGELLDVDVLSHTPGEIRRMIKRYELEHPPGGQE